MSDIGSILSQIEMRQQAKQIRDTALSIGGALRDEGYCFESACQFLHNMIDIMEKHSLSEGKTPMVSEVTADLYCSLMQELWDE